MDEADHSIGSSSGSLHLAPPPSVVSLSSFSPVPSPASRRLSSHFTPSRPVTSARRLSWVSLQGRILNAEEASSAKAIGGGLTRDQIIAWELFSPIQRFLTVAVIGVAVAESKKNSLIFQLKKSVELRDQVLLRMQQKLDDLCEQVSGIKATASLSKNVESPSSDAFGGNTIKFVDCGCWHCDHHQGLFADFMANSAVNISRGDEVLQYKMPLLNEGEQEERRMSDLSDWASSVTSTADIQMNSSALDQDILNLKRECEDKDATIKELISTIRSTDMAGSKRIAELEDIIRRKNTTVSKLKKDMMVLEEKLVQLTRLRRKSSSLRISDCWELPHMLDNLVYDMDSSTSPSSSDSDSSPGNRAQASAVKNLETPVQSSYISQASTPSKTSSSLAILNERQTKSGSASPLGEISVNKKSSLRPKQLSTSGEFKKIRRRSQTTSTDAAPKKRWV